MPKINFTKQLLTYICHDGIQDTKLVIRTVQTRILYTIITPAVDSFTGLQPINVDEISRKNHVICLRFLLYSVSIKLNAIKSRIKTMISFKIKLYILFHEGKRLYLSLSKRR